MKATLKIVSIIKLFKFIPIWTLQVCLHLKTYYNS